ncbi:MAG: efflux RND transporter periplasmic adaptor subunit [Bacteroidetes bacterium]|nr:efflux RND transporter periplasmic adaptor subunit [Bacteroidota bacterium]
MKKFYILPALALVLVVLIVIKIFRSDKTQAVKPGKAPVPAVPAECFLVRDTTVNFPLNTVGNVRSNERVEIVSEISRRVVAIGFKEGNNVKQGELLFRLDDAEFQADLKKLTSQLELATQTEARNKQLLSSGGISQQLYDESFSRKKTLEAEAELIRIQIDKTLIRAPFSGKTGLRNVSEGALVTPGTVLTTLEDVSSLKLDFTVPEKYASSVDAGNLLNFRIEGFPKVYEARVEATDPSVDRLSGSLKVRAVIQKPDRNIIPGISTELWLTFKTAEPGLYIPTQCLIPTLKGYLVYLKKQGKAKPQPVVSGMRSEKMVEITGGLALGDTVITTNLLKMKPNVPLKIQKTW